MLAAATPLVIPRFPSPPVAPDAPPAAPSPPAPWLRYRQVIALSGWSEWYLRKLVDNGDVRTTATRGPKGFTRRRYARADVERLIAAEVAAAQRKP